MGVTDYRIHTFILPEISAWTLESRNAFWVMLSMPLRCLNSILSGHLCLARYSVSTVFLAHDANITSHKQ